MVTGHYVKCTTEDCGQEYRIRFNIGDVFPQQGTFKCKKCGKNLTYGFDEKRNVLLKGIEFSIDSANAIVQNIHPELPIDPSRESDPYYFPSPEYIVNYDKAKKGDLSKFREGQKSMAKFKIELDKIEPHLRYLSEKRCGLLETTYGREEEKVRKKVIKKALEVGRLFIDGKWLQFYREGLSEVEKAKRIARFSDLKQYLLGRRDDLLVERLYAVIKLYNKNYHELLPTLLSQKFDIQVNGNSSSADWDKLEKVYGDLYEIIGDLMVIPTAVNNLLARNDYQLFQSSPAFNFQRYLDSDKAGRCNNFSANSKLNWLEQFYDAGIRNATHHKASKTENEDQVIVLKTGKGGNIEKRISMIEYISFCNELFARSMILFMYLFKLTY